VKGSKPSVLRRKGQLERLARDAERAEAERKAKTEAEQRGAWPPRKPNPDAGDWINLRPNRPPFSTV
jgi:hypothetical protein